MKKLSARYTNANKIGLLSSFRIRTASSKAYFTFINILMKNSSHPSIDSLPDEMLLKIFGYFSIYSVHNTIGAVCSRWKVLSRVPSLNRNISIYSHHDINFLNTLPTTHYISSLKFYASDLEFNNSFNYIGSICPNLTHLKIASHILCDSKALAIISTRFPNLKHLNVHSIDRCVKEFLNAVHYIQSIVMHNSIPQGVLSSMANLCQNLTELRIEDNPWEDNNDELKYFLRMKSKNLTKLILGFADDSVLELIASCKKLTDLRLSNCMEVHIDGLMKLVALRLLHTLHLTGLIQISEMSLNDFIEECDMTKLIDLSLIGSSFSDFTVKILCNKKLVLRKIELISCDNLSSNGALHLSRHIKNVIIAFGYNLERC